MFRPPGKRSAEGVAGKWIDDDVGPRREERR